MTRHGRLGNIEHQQDWVRLQGVQVARNNDCLAERISGVKLSLVSMPKPWENQSWDLDQRYRDFTILLMIWLVSLIIGSRVNVQRTQI